MKNSINSFFKLLYKNIFYISFFSILIFSFLFMFNKLNEKIYNEKIVTLKSKISEIDRKKEFFSWEIIFPEKDFYSNKIFVSFEGLPLAERIDLSLKSENCELFYSSTDHWLSGFFDYDWYYQNAQDVKNANFDAWYHYVKYGHKENRKIHPFFDFNVNNYRIKYKSKKDINELLHFIVNPDRFGKNKNSFNFQNSSFSLSTKKNEVCNFSGKFILDFKIKLSDLDQNFFSEHFYKLTNFDSANLIDYPFEHFKKTGWKEYKIPHPRWIGNELLFKSLVDKSKNIDELIKYLKINQPHFVNSSDYLKLNSYTEKGKISVDFPVNFMVQTNRIYLLKWTWGEVGEYIPLILIITFFLSIFGITLFIFSNSLTKIILGNFIAIFALGIFHSVFHPPYFAPDEDFHLFSLYQIVKNNKWKYEDIDLEGRRLHFARIRWYADKKFDVFTKEKPFLSGWRGETEGADKRSLLTYWIWHIPTFFIKEFTLLQGLLFYRIFHALIFSLMCAISLIFLKKITNSSKEFKSFPIVWIVPVVPHFSTMISDYSIVSSLSIFTATILVSPIIREKKCHFIEGLLIGILIFLLLFSSLPATFIFIPIFVLIIFYLKELERLHKIYFLTLCLLPTVFMIFFLEKTTFNQNSDFLRLQNKVVSYVNSDTSQEGISQEGISQEGISQEGISQEGISQEKKYIQWLKTPPEVVNVEAFGQIYSKLEFSYIVTIHISRLMLPVQQDHLLFKTFWVGHGWQDFMQIYPNYLITIWSGFSGFFIFILFFYKKEKNIYLFSILSSTFIAILACCVVGYMLGVNTQGRYLIPEYYVIYSISGFGALIFFNRFKKGKYLKEFLTFIIVIWPQNIIYYTIERYFG